MKNAQVSANPSGEVSTQASERSALVSVVICNYNYGRFLAEAIDSVLEQDYPNVELIVVDDGSTDESEKVLAGYEKRVRVIRQENAGVSAARNRGIRESRGTFLAFLDSDDVWARNKLTLQLSRFDDPSVGMVYTGLRYVDTSGARIKDSLPGFSGKVLRELVLLHDPGVPASGSSAVLRREVLERVGGFDERLSTSADWDMWRRVSCGYRIERVSEPLVYYRQHGTAMHKNVPLFEKDMLRAFESAFSDPEAASIHPIRRRCYAKLYMVLAGSYQHAGNWRKCLACILRAAAQWPPSLSYAVLLPWRQITRRLRPSRTQS